MKKCFFIVGIFILSFVLVYGYSNHAFACPHPTSVEDPNYQPHCGIWLCLPGGFGNGCSEQKKAFKWRLKKPGCPALPRYSGCAQNSASDPYKVEADVFRCRRSGEDREFQSGRCNELGKSGMYADFKMIDNQTNQVIQSDTIHLR
jgi:hypothetical protein